MIALTRRCYARLRGFQRNAKLYLVSTTITGLSLRIHWLLLNLYVLELGFHEDFLGLLQAVPAFVALFTAFPAGLLTNRIGRRQVMLLGGFGQAMALTGILIQRKQTAMVAMMALYGASLNLYKVSTAPFIMEISDPDDRTTLFSADFSLNTLAGVGGALLGGCLPMWFGRWLGQPAESAVSYRLALAVGAGLQLLAMIPIGMVSQSSGSPSQCSTRLVLPSWTESRPRLVVQLALPHAMSAMALAMTLSLMNVFFKDRFPIAHSTLGWVFALQSLFISGAALLGPAMTWRWGKIQTVLATQLASIPFLLALGLVSVFPAAVAAFWTCMALMYLGYPLYQSFAMEQVSEREQATANSLICMGWSIGWAVGPYIAGVVQVSAGFNPIFVAASVLCAASSCLMWCFFGRSGQRVCRDCDASSGNSCIKALGGEQT